MLQNLLSIHISFMFKKTHVMYFFPLFISFNFCFSSALCLMNALVYVNIDQEAFMAIYTSNKANFEGFRLNSFIGIFC